MTPTPENLTTRTLLPQLVMTATNDLQCINIAQGHYFRSGGRGTKKEKNPPMGKASSDHSQEASVSLLERKSTTNQSHTCTIWYFLSKARYQSTENKSSDWQKQWLFQNNVFIHLKSEFCRSVSERHIFPGKHLKCASNTSVTLCHLLSFESDSHCYNMFLYSHLCRPSALCKLINAQLRRII